MAELLTGRVIKIIDEYKLVINKGAKDGVEKSNRFLIYRLGEELFDPDDGHSLGWLEIVCGEGRPEHIQEHLTTLITDRQEKKHSKTIIRRKGSNAFMPFGDNGTIEETYDPEIVQIPFDEADEGCLCKQIK